MKDEADAVLWNHGAFFRLGCQGPDIFYHSQRLKPVALSYGVLLHKRLYGSFAEALLRFWKERDGKLLSPLAAYIAGFATHAALDRATHPFIIYFAGWVDSKKPFSEQYHRCHAFLERILDVLLLEEHRNMEIGQYDFRVAFFPPGDLPPLLLEGIAEALRAVYPEHAGEDDKLGKRVENAFADAFFFYYLTNPARTSLKGSCDDFAGILEVEGDRKSAALLYPETFPRSIDYLNRTRAPWRHPCGEGPADARSFDELYAEARSLAEPALGKVAAALRGESGPEGLADLVGEGNLSLGSAGGSPCAPVHSAPLPLAELIDEQFVIRSKWLASLRACR